MPYVTEEVVGSCVVRRQSRKGAGVTRCPCSRHAVDRNLREAVDSVECWPTLCSRGLLLPDVM